MTDYGQSNREVVQDTNAGLVDPPVTERPGTSSTATARKVVDRNVGQEHRLAEALVDTAGQFGQQAVAQKHRNEKIEGAKIVADGKGEEYINATKPTFAEKIFGNKPKKRVAQEMQVQQEVNKLDDSMREWVNDEGHKLDTEEFQAEYDKRYDEVAGKYEDDQMKDLIAATYSQNLETTRREHAKAKDLFDQQHLRDTTMKGWSESGARAKNEINSSDSQTKSEALGKYAKSLEKPEGMSQSAYEAASFDHAMNELAQGRPEAFALLDADGVFDNLSIEQSNALEEMQQINQIKNNEAFGKKMQSLQTLVSSGNVEGARALAQEIQLENPKAIDSINSIVASTEAALATRQQEIAENQKQRRKNSHYLNTGQMHLIPPDQVAQAYADADEDIINSMALDNRAAQTGDTYTEGPLEGQDVGRAGDLPTENERLAAMDSDIYKEKHRADFIARGDTNNPKVQASVHRLQTIQSYDPVQLRNNPELTAEADAIMDELVHLSALPAGKALLSQYFDSEEDYLDYRDLDSDRQTSNLPDALARNQRDQARREQGLTHGEPDSKAVNRYAKHIKSDFRKGTEASGIFNRNKIDNGAQFDNYVDDLMETQLKKHGGDARRAAAGVEHHLNNVDAIIGNKFVPEGAKFLDRQAELTPERSQEDIIGLMLSTPENQQALKQAGIPDVITWEKNDIGQTFPRINYNRLNQAGVELMVVGDNLEMAFNEQPGKPRMVPLRIPPVTEDRASTMMTYGDRFKDGVVGAADTGFSALDSGAQIVIADRENLQANYDYTKAKIEAQGGSDAQLAVQGIKDSITENVTDPLKSIPGKAASKLTDMMGATPEVLQLAAKDLKNFLYPQDIVTDKSERGFQSPRHQEASHQSKEKREEHLREKAEDTERLRQLLAELEAS